MPQLRAAYRSALPDVQEDDVLGSPYCVRDYVVDERFGGPDGLAAARHRLAERDLALILDYVPNHVAAEHPWVTDRPDYFVAGSDAELAAHPEEFMEIGGGVFAKGRDPRVSNGVVTASHVVAACPPATALAPTRVGAMCSGRARRTISFGYGLWGTVSIDDPTHDLALVDYQSEVYPEPNTDPNPTPLRPESRPAYVGEPLALLGIPALPLLGNPFKRQVTVVQGSIVATNHTQVLTSATGDHETLRDAIEVAVPRVVPGQSGGPAIDSAGKVVGVIEGSAASGIATLTPVTDLTSLH